MTPEGEHPGGSWDGKAAEPLKCLTLEWRTKGPQRVCLRLLP